MLNALIAVGIILIATMLWTLWDLRREVKWIRDLLDN